MARPANPGLDRQLAVGVSCPPTLKTIVPPQAIHARAELTGANSASIVRTLEFSSTSESSHVRAQRQLGPSATGREDRPHALLVEDNGIAAGAIQRFLESRGWKVTHVGTVAAAMAALGALPDWIILDLMLPDGNGVRVLREIRCRDLPIAVAVTTAATDPDHLQEVHDLEPEVFLHKPFTSSDIGRAMGIR